MSFDIKYSIFRFFKQKIGFSEEKLTNLSIFSKKTLLWKNPVFRDGMGFFGTGLKWRDGIQFWKISGRDPKNSGIFGTGRDRDWI